jgi:predicted transcriptional regulator
VCVAERAEQLRACDVHVTRVAALLGVSPAALAAYYAVQDEIAAA